MSAFAQQKLVRTPLALEQATAVAQPGDTILIDARQWNDVQLNLQGNGAAGKPVVVRPTGEWLVFQGSCRLRLSGAYLEIQNFHFEQGFPAERSLISFKNEAGQLANHCTLNRVKVIEFDKGPRLTETHYLSLYGKDNRITHCTFGEKANLGVTIAVHLDEDASRNNGHSIDHNLFSGRAAIGSNGGEIIRVGVSQHCQFNSGTRIFRNLFDRCNGEAEIISIKSGGNRIEGNRFIECEGAVVLRHGNNNLVQGNVWEGYGKANTGGVRIVNEDNWVTNNKFSNLKGTGFRSPLAVMAGVPNSPANRYLPVKGLLVYGNGFFHCAPPSFNEGLDAERSAKAENVLLLENRWPGLSQHLPTAGFRVVSKASVANPRYHALLDSLDQLAQVRWQTQLEISLFDTWLAGGGVQRQVSPIVPAKPTASQFQAASDGPSLLKLLRKRSPAIELTGTTFHLAEPLLIEYSVVIRSKQQVTTFSLAEGNSVFVQKAGGSLMLSGWTTTNQAGNFGLLQVGHRGEAGHHALVLNNCSFRNWSSRFALIQSAPASYLDSLVVRNCRFENTSGNLFGLDADTARKGLYHAEKIVLANNVFQQHHGAILTVTRPGNDESTVGPHLFVRNNRFENVKHAGPLFSLQGVQHSWFEGNRFKQLDVPVSVIRYDDATKAVHQHANNLLPSSATHLFTTSKQL